VDTEDNETFEISNQMFTVVNRLRIALMIEIVYVILYTSVITAVRVRSALTGLIKMQIIVQNQMIAVSKYETFKQHSLVKILSKRYE